jgi:hypothetical protein
VVVVALVALGGGFGGGADPGGPPPTAAGAPPATTGSAPAAPPPGITTIIDSATDDRFGTDPARFATPSGNIACALSGDETRCDVLENSWDLPPAPADCDQDFGSGTLLVGDRAGELSCVGDTVAEPGLPVLEYGTALRHDGVLCASRETGLRCEDERTGHGFEVARAAYELF